MIRKECQGCKDWLAGEFCGRIQFGLTCVHGPFDMEPGKITWVPEGESPNGVYAQTLLKASATQVAGDHYKKMGVEPWDVVDTWPLEQRIGAYRHGALKYLMRMGSKDQSAQEIAKGKHYMEKLLEVLQSAA